MTGARFFLLFVLISGLHLLSLLAWPAAAAYTKPLLLPLLIMAVWQAGAAPFRSLLIAALFFSWIGDVVLLFAHKGELFFIGGLVAFLIAHVCYILLFNKTISQYARARNYQWWAWVLLIVYLTGLMSLLFPHLQALKIPVLVYGFVIGAMMATAIRGWAYWPAGAARWIVLGAAAFVISDSLLAVNKFYTPLPLAPFFIMITYLGAQYGIVRGSLRHEE